MLRKFFLNALKMCYGYTEPLAQTHMGKKLMLTFNSNFRFKDLKLITITHFKYTAEETNSEVMWMSCPHLFTPQT